jgi:hypothetical protein
MRYRTLRFAGVLSMSVLLASAGIAFADTVPADGDAISGDQNLVSLGVRAPGEVVTRDVSFRLLCGGTTHPAAGSVTDVFFGSATVPLDGAVSATATTIGPVPQDWPLTGNPCPSPAPSLGSSGPSVVTLTMPTTPGTGYRYSILFAKSGASGVVGLTFMTFTADVVANTPPHLNVPANQTAEATSPAGATVSFSATATDAEDATPPTPICTPPSGSTFAIGTTSVACTVTDSGGKSDSGSFTVTVSDTTPPTLVGMPSDMTLTTGNPAGTTLTYTAPGATDAADPDPEVNCSPASGSAIPVGTTTVTCTATDAAGLSTSASFTATVTFVSPVVWSAVWGAPVSSPDGTFVSNAGRTIPVKVELFADGVEQTAGEASLSVVACDGGTPMSMALTFDSGRWNGHLGAGTVGGPGCYIVTALGNGNIAGSFRLDVRGGETAPANGPKGTSRR